MIFFKLSILVAATLVAAGPNDPGGTCPIGLVMCCSCLANILPRPAHYSQCFVNDVGVQETGTPENRALALEKLGEIGGDVTAETPVWVRCTDASDPPEPW
jgi:hypothetical protein